MLTIPIVCTYKVLYYIGDVPNFIFVSAYITIEPRTSSRQLKTPLARLVILTNQRYMLHIKIHFNHLEVSSISVLPSLHVIATLYISRLESLKGMRKETCIMFMLQV